MHLVTPLFCYLFLLINRLSFLIAAATADDNIAINCGSSGNSIAPDGRIWVGDVGSQFLFPRRTKNSKTFSFIRHHHHHHHHPHGSVFSNSVPPYLTARISTTEFSYTFRVNPGQKFIRLHFSPAPYPGFDRLKSIFTVKAGPYTLLRNFTPSLNAADVLGKEFCLNFEQEQAFTITFSPSAEAYALISGIEILSIPTGLYHTPDGDQGGGSLVVGQKYRFHIDNSTALELIQRVNIGGSAILPRDDGSTLRVWSPDIDYWLEPGISPIITANNITYMNLPSSYVAPQRLYQTARFVNHRLNLTRKVMVDVGFRYLIRLHFCELDAAIRGRGQRQFNIYVNERIAESKGDLFEWSGGSNLALHRDYVMTMQGDQKREGKRKLVVALEPTYYHESKTEQVVVLAGAILNGLEVFKLSNPDNNLAGQKSYTPMGLSSSKSKSKSKSPMLLLVFYKWSTTSVSGLIVLMTLLNILFYKLRLQVQVDKSANKKNNTSSDKSCRRFSLEEIVVAANNFDEALVIGDGGFGRVYKGVIEKGTITVAVKRLKSMSKQGADEFWTEIKTLSKVRHPHLVTLIGYCDESDEKILVYEYAVNGTLADHLYMMKTSRTLAADLLSWEQRLNICIGAARGLEYLHTGTQHKIIHRDVKASNILLGDNWVAKISDFGLSKMSGRSNETIPSLSPLITTTTTDIMGTFGYLDTDYFLTQRLTRKSDVYAFGVLLFEVLSGRPAIDRNFEGEQRSLALWAQRCIKDGKLDHIIDPNLNGQISPHSLKVFAEVASKCLHSRPNGRPRISDVLQRLEFALLLQTQHAAYSSTDTVQEEDDADADAVESSIIDNMQIDPITEEEEEEEEDEDNYGIDGHGSTGSPISLQDSITTIPKAKSQKKTYSKVFDGIAKSMDLRRRKPKTNGSSNIQEANGISSSSSGRTAWWRQRTRSFGEVRLSTSSSLLERPCRHFSLTEMRAATKNFHRKLIIKYGGPGGEMYRGYIDNGYLQVAIERLTRATNKSKFVEEEMELRSQLYHRNLVPFIGYCKDEDEDEMVLVYQYMVKGNLSNHLYGTSNEPPLPWKKRLEICVGVAQGLQYLHNKKNIENPIIHGNIKTSSILLDEKWVAKISGGLKCLKGDHVFNSIDAASNNKSTTRTIVRTIVMDSSSIVGGYMDPTYYYVLGDGGGGGGGGGHNNLTKESDVYSFGVVLLEVLCAREPLIPHLINRDEKNLVHWFKSCMQKKEIDRIIDKHLIGKIAPKCLRVFVRIVEWCLQFRAVDRPSIDVVLRRLQDALLLQEGAGGDDIF